MSPTAAPRTLVVVFETINVCTRFLPLPPDRQLIFTYGEQVPTGAGVLSYWTSGEHAARLQRAGLAPALAAPPQDWMSTVDPDHLGREVFTVPLSDLPTGHDRLFIKPAGIKIPGLSAAVWNPAQYAARARELDVPDQSLVQYTATVLDLDLEHRFVVVDGKVVTGSPYLIAGTIYHRQMTSPHFAEAEAYARRAVIALGAACPPAFTLDVGWDRATERWVVIEPNPLWSSGMYGCDPVAFTGGVEVANTAGEGQWAWAPDAYQRQLADQAPLVCAVPAGESAEWMAVPLL